jgi:hypothetical protein
VAAAATAAAAKAVTAAAGKPAAVTVAGKPAAAAAAVPATGKPAAIPSGPPSEPAAYLVTIRIPKKDFDAFLAEPSISLPTAPVPTTTFTVDTYNTLTAEVKQLLNGAIESNYVYYTDYDKLPPTVQTYFFNNTQDTYSPTPFPGSNKEVHYFKPDRKQELAVIIAKSTTP